MKFYFAKSTREHPPPQISLSKDGAAASQGINFSIHLANSFEHLRCAPLCASLCEGMSSWRLEAAEAGGTPKYTHAANNCGNMRGKGEFCRCVTKQLGLVAGVVASLIGDFEAEPLINGIVKEFTKPAEGRGGEALERAIHSHSLALGSFSSHLRGLAVLSS